MTSADAIGTRRTALRLGTRRSPLALAQSRQIGRRIEAAIPGVRVELAGIETRGDRILETPLWKTQGRDFFSAELDEALVSGRVDLTVHSLKDLALDRSERLAVAAIPPREDPRDIVLFHPRVLDHLTHGEPIRIGTSSPRRLALVPPFLQQALPAKGRPPVLEFTEIRGNLDSRLRRLRLPKEDPKRMDAVVVALAGLVRLHSDEDGSSLLGGLLQDLRWMVLPLRECPGAPGQGALAVEVRADDVWLRDSLRRLHDTTTEQQVLQERTVLREWGGGCHQALGASASDHPDLGTLLHVRGRRPSGECIQQVTWSHQHPLPSRPGNAKLFDGTQLGTAGEPRPSGASNPTPLPPGRSVWVTHIREIPRNAVMDQAHLWTPDASTWFQLSALGYWICGCADGLGLEFIRKTAEQPVLAPQEHPWLMLAEGGTPTEPRLEIPEDHRPELAKQLQHATHLFWASGEQFLRLRPLVTQFAAGARHACGPGPTGLILREAGIDPDFFPSPDDWRHWIGHP